MALWSEALCASMRDRSCAATCSAGDPVVSGWVVVWVVSCGAGAEGDEAADVSAPDATWLAGEERMTISAITAPQMARTTGTPVMIAQRGTPRLGGALRRGRGGAAGGGAGLWSGGGAGGAGGLIPAPQPVQNCVPGLGGRPHLGQNPVISLPSAPQAVACCAPGAGNAPGGGAEGGGAAVPAGAASAVAGRSDPVTANLIPSSAQACIALMVACVDSKRRV